MAKKLYLTFESMSGKEKSIAVSLPKPNLTKETIEAAANVLISKNAMAGNWLWCSVCRSYRQENTGGCIPHSYT